MRALLINTSFTFFGGAEKTLLYFVDALSARKTEFSVVTVRDSKLSRSLPSHVRQIAISNNERFSIPGLLKQLRELKHVSDDSILHGWTARDWELTTSLRALTRRPAIGTLHDHPQSSYITPKRQKLMRLLSRHGLSKTFCVSDAVREACIACGYSTNKLATIHNGLPCENSPRNIRLESGHPVRVGYLGVLAPHKGFGELFQIMERIHEVNPRANIELRIAGEAQDEAGRELVKDIKASYAATHWWPRVTWLGWIDSPESFLKSIDILIAPSKSFDSFPTALLEAGREGVPALTSDAGGGPEIIRHGETGWVYPAGNPNEGAQALVEALAQPSRLNEISRQAADRIRSEFDISRMVHSYLEAYALER